MLEAASMMTMGIGLFRIWKVMVVFILIGLNMLYPRFRIAKDFFSDDGIIFISIDDNEIRILRMNMR